MPGLRPISAVSSIHEMHSCSHHRVSPAEPTRAAGAQEQVSWKTRRVFMAWTAGLIWVSDCRRRPARPVRPLGRPFGVQAKRRAAGLPLSVDYRVRHPHDAALNDHLWFLAGQFRTPDPRGGFVTWLVLRCTNPACEADAAVSESCPLSSVPLVKRASLADRLRNVMTQPLLRTAGITPALQEPSLGQRSVEHRASGRRFDDASDSSRAVASSL